LKINNKIRQSAGNYKYLNVYKILRDNTPKFIDYKNFDLFALRSYVMQMFMINSNIRINHNLEYTSLEFEIKEKDNRYFNLNDIKDINEFNDNFKNYLAGLIEGDGTILVPTSERSKLGRLNYPSVQICFDLRDLPLAMIIQKVFKHGSLSRTKGVNAYRLIINNYEGLIILCRMLKDKMRTVKNNDLNNLIN
jgi:hypothetical protein